MEQTQDLKQEMQHDLAVLQQDIADHSRFDTDEWRQGLLRRTRRLYRQNLAAVAVIAVLVAVILAMTFSGRWPWWLGVPAALYFGWMVVDNLVATHGMAHPDVESDGGLRSLRETIRHSNEPYGGWRKTVLIVGGLLVGTLVLLQVVPGELWMYILILPVSGIAGHIASKRVSRRYHKLDDDLGQSL